MGSRTNYSALMQVVDPSSMAVINFTVPLNMYIHLDFTIPTTWQPGPCTLRTVVRHVNGTVAWENSRNPFEILPTRTPIAGALSCSLSEPTLIWFHGFRSVTPAVQITIVTFHTKASSFQTCNRTEFEVASEFQVAASATIVNGSGLFRSDPNNYTLHPHVRSQRQLLLRWIPKLEFPQEAPISIASWSQALMANSLDS